MSCVWCGSERNVLEDHWENHLGMWLDICARCHVMLHSWVFKGVRPVADLGLLAREDLDLKGKVVDEWVNHVAAFAVAELARSGFFERS